MKPLVSIIVPVFNVEAYLERCLDSLLIQTLQDIEIIIIDDGSTDGSRDICDRYAAKDGRLRVIHTENEGLSAARNKGIVMSRADWIMFVDSDDWVEPDFCETPYRAAVRSGADIVLFRWRKNGKGCCPGIKRNKYPEGLIPGEQFIDMLYRYGFMTAWCKLYDKKLFNEVRFPEGKIYEDVITTCRLAEIVEYALFIDKRLYNYTEGRFGSITNTVGKKMLKDRTDAQAIMIDFFQRRGYDTAVLEENWALGTLLRYGHIGIFTDRHAVNIVKNIKGFPNEFTTKRKIMLAVWRLSPLLFDIICYATKKRARTRDT